MLLKQMILKGPDKCVYTAIEPALKGHWVL